MKRAIAVIVVPTIALAIGLGAGGCEDKKPQNLAPAASSLAPSTVAPSAKSMKFVIDPKSGTSIDMPAPKEHIKAGTDGAAGTLDVDFMNLAQTRGEVKADLTTLSTKTFGEADKDKTQTGHARTWLEVADGEEGKLPDDVKAANKYAVYAIRSIDNLSATDLTKLAATKDGADEVRTVTATTHGEFLIHGHKVDRDADVEVAFHYPPGAAADKPTSLTIKSKKPLRATLSEHDVKPRDGFGKIAKGAFNLLGTKVAEVADITLDLRATPQS
ncbi:MAG: hypothetical protein JWP87_1278 [Labilithrix sp.]|jgi:hypothetical protein|nr:hypothetical protein [Labilithrix sp.]